jgi:hypothetical protein
MHTSCSRAPRREPIARAAGCATVKQYTGHGINNHFHPAPTIPHYAKNRAVGTMKPGMVRPLSLCRHNGGHELTSGLTHPVLHHRAGTSPQDDARCACAEGTQMINLGPHPDTDHWPDNWTATTIDGKRSAQFEETLLCVPPRVYCSAHVYADRPPRAQHHGDGRGGAHAGEASGRSGVEASRFERGYAGPPPGVLRTILSYLRGRRDVREPPGRELNR